MAAGRVDPISAINPTKTDWIIKVRVVRIWLMPTSPSTSSYHGIEMVLCDSECFLGILSFIILERLITHRLRTYPMNSKDKISKAGIQRDSDGVVFEKRSRRKISIGQENCFPSNSQQAFLPVVMSDITTSKVATELKGCIPPYSQGVPRVLSDITNLAPVVHHFASTPLIHGVTYNHNLYPAIPTTLRHQ
ncbi:uncharacterized protein G2W53_039636 [Senna tora]|uniref:Uncharacterized protein n=2 Tax=Senna tora TaxID=362788 RepID=A0A834SMY0_9FABA|nr:uncharacterized protein G2W53_039636 [Senna tora]